MIPNEVAEGLARRWRCCLLAAVAPRRRRRRRRDVPLPGQRLHRHDQRQGSEGARLQDDRGRADHRDPERASRKPAAAAGPAAAGGIAARPAPRVDPADAAGARQRCPPHPRGRAARARSSGWPCCRRNTTTASPSARATSATTRSTSTASAEMKAAIARKESDIAAIKRELGKLPQVNAADLRRARCTPAPTAGVVRRARPAGDDGGDRRSATATACSSTPRSRTCSACRAAACCAARCSTGSSSRRCMRETSPRSAATTSRPAASRPTCAARAQAGRDAAGARDREPDGRLATTVVVELVEVEQQTRQDREERALEPGAGQQGADPQPRARDQEPARRHPRRGAAARDGGRVARADRVHPGHHQRGRPAAGAGRPAARAAPQAARGGRRQHPRGLRARALADPGRVPARPEDRARLRHLDPRLPRRPRAADPGGAQHRAQRRAGARVERIEAGDARIMLRTRIARQVTLGKQRYRLALELHIEDNGRAFPRPSGIASSFRWCRGAKGGRAWG